MDIQLSLIGSPHDWVRPLFDGAARPEGVELAITRSPPPEAMRRQLTSWEFDICEMAFGAYLVAREKGADFIAIPAFPMRGFFHTQFACHADAGIGSARELAGKRLGVPEYVQTAALWARGILQHDFGMEPERVQWFVERAGADSTGAVLGLEPPTGLSLKQTPDGKGLGAMLAAHELDAALVGRIPQMAEGKVRLLFPDIIAEGKRYFDAHGYIPANHTYIVRGEVLRKNPGLATQLYRAFREAKAIAEKALPQSLPSGLVFGGEYLARTRQLFGQDPFAYGVGVNRKMLEAVILFAHEQGMIRKRPSVEEIFATVEE